MTTRRLDLDTYSRQFAAVVVFSMLGVIFARLVVTETENISVRVLIGTVVVVVLLGLSFYKTSAAVVAVVAYSAVVGLLRRLIPDDGASIDALLVGIPVTTVVLAGIAFRRGATSNSTRRSSLVVLLLLLAGVGALNPLQGSLVVGVVGVAFFGVPMLWYFVGRFGLDDRDMRQILMTAAIVAVPISLYGLAQARGFFLARDREILEAPSGSGSFLDGELRPIGTMASTGEFARFSMVAAMIWLVVALFRTGRGLSSRWALVPFFLLLSATLFSGVRVSLVTGLVALGLIVAASSQMRPLHSGILGVAAVILVMVVIQFAAQAPTDNFIIDRQLAGLSDPTSASSASIGKRVTLAQRTLQELPKYPIGRGTGLTTPAGSRFGESTISTETDVGDVAASWGVPGLVAYGTFVVLSIRAGYKVARSRRDLAGLGALAVIGVAMSQWINGGLYAVAPLVWICLGWIDRQARDLSDEEQAAAASADVAVAELAGAQQ